MSASFEFLSASGICRDGTPLDSSYYSDGEWVRFRRGKPRKMGGYRAMSQLANGPVRALLVDSRNGINSAHYFSQWGVQRQQFSPAGAGGGLEDRSPVAFTADSRLSWTHGILSSSTGGSYSALVAGATPDVDQIDSDAAGRFYTGGMADSAPLTMLSDNTGPLSFSGGCCILHPFPFFYGSNGVIRNGDANSLSPTSLTPGTGFANEANVSGTKFVFGAPVRGGGQSPAGLFWSLDALVRVSFIGGTEFWSYDTISSPASVLAKKAIVEHDGKFYWPGTDRFLMYNGVVQEIPNLMNSDYFFDNLNYAARNKVWGTKITRFGEIWWFYPRGSSTECDNAIIFNYLENTWYDAAKARSAGGQIQLFAFPIWAGSEDAQDTVVLTTGMRLLTTVQANSGTNVLTFSATGPVQNGWLVSGDGIPAGTTVSSKTATTVTLSNNVTANVLVGAPITFSSMLSPFLPGTTVTGGTTGATGTVVRATPTNLNVRGVTGAFNATEALTGSNAAAATSIAATFAQRLESVYQQEFGVDKILGQDVVALRSSFSSKAFGFAVGQPFAEAPQTVDVMTKVTRLDPDFGQAGTLQVILNGRSFTSDAYRELERVNCSQTDRFLTFEQQERELVLKIESNEKGGYFEQGKAFIQLDQGDERSSADMPSGVVS